MGSMLLDPRGASWDSPLGWHHHQYETKLKGGPGVPQPASQSCSWQARVCPKYPGRCEVPWETGGFLSLALAWALLAGHGGSQSRAQEDLKEWRVTVVWLPSETVTYVRFRRDMP